MNERPGPQGGQGLLYLTDEQLRRGIEAMFFAYRGFTADPDRILAIIGGRDDYTPPADVDALAATGVTVVRYPEAEHGFAHDASRPSHRADDAADAFARARAWLTSSR